MTAESTAICDQQRAGAAQGSRGMQRLGRTGSTTAVARRSKADERAVRAKPARTLLSGIVDACGPKSPDSHRVVSWGLASRPPGHPVGFPPVYPLPAGFVPVVRRPLVSRPAFSGSFPSAVARFRFPFGFPPGPFPLSDLQGSAAAGRFGRPWSRAAGTKATGHAAPPARIVRSARTPDGQRPGTKGCRHRIACYERPRAQDTAAPEPPRSAGAKTQVALRNRLPRQPSSSAGRGHGYRLSTWPRLRSRGCARSAQPCPRHERKFG